MKPKLAATARQQADNVSAATSKDLLQCEKLVSAGHESAKQLGAADLGIKTSMPPPLTRHQKYLRTVPAVPATN
jgi:hypothetical protein